MRVEKSEFTILMKKDDTVREITSTKFYEVVVPRNLKKVGCVFEAKDALLAGEEVDGALINMRGMTFKKVEVEDAC